MPYVRLSIAKPRHGQEERVADIMRKLNEFAASQPGCVTTMLLRPHDESGEIARMSIFQDENAADHVAQTDHVLSLRSELHLAVEAGHIERAFFTE
jgi:quinol monooxygenase YgiN